VRKDYALGVVALSRAEVEEEIADCAERRTVLVAGWDTDAERRILG
jgi:hypothetical protein